MSKERRLELRVDDDFLGMLDEVQAAYGFGSRAKVLRRLVADAHRVVRGLPPLGPTRVRRPLEMGPKPADAPLLTPTDIILAAAGVLGDKVFVGDESAADGAEP